MQYAKNTHLLAHKLPFWFDIHKRKENTNGLKYLDVFGIELDEEENSLDYAYRQNKINFCDVSFPYMLYMVSVPTTYSLYAMELVKTADGKILSESKRTAHFLGIEKGDRNETIHYSDYYFADLNNNIIYFREDIKSCTVIFNNKESIELEVKMHPLWNFFDEFGALLSLKRIFNEDNIKYKDRIKDVFKFKSSSSKEGLMFGISRELGLSNHISWDMDHKDTLILPHDMITANYIYLNGNVLDYKYYVYTDDDGKIYLKSFYNPEEKNLISDIFYMFGIEITSFIQIVHDRLKTDYAALCITPDNFYTDKFLYYIDKSEEICGTRFGTLKYDEYIFDDMIKLYPKQSYGFIPSHFDLKDTGFKNYKKPKERGHITIESRH